MHIQWFPGHMTKAMRMMEESVKLCDAVIFILDARCPLACVNEELEKLSQNKPILYVLNKSDLSSPESNRGFIKYFAEEGKSAIVLVGTNNNTAKILSIEIKKLLDNKIKANLAKGVKKPLRIMIAGIPNTGKSTIINSVIGTKKAITGDKAGVTKGKQWLKIDDLELLDTPGTMPPSFSNQLYAKHLAFIGSINDDILDFSELAYELINELKVYNQKELNEKYGIEDFEKPTLEIFEDICKRRGFLVKGGEFDYERCARAIIDDFRKGRIGRISLERAY